MKKFIIALSAAMALSIAPAFAQNCPFIPAPAEYVLGEGRFSLPEVVSITATSSVNDATIREVSKYLSMRGIKNRIGSGDIFLGASDNIAPEGYSLEIAPTGIRIVASSDAGYFYAVQTLAQLIEESPDGSLVACSISDYPRFEHRGLMLDPSRWFIPKEEIIKMIDAASALKINRLHLHLADDNGWRIEIKKYPKLTEVGAWRVEREEYFPGRLNPKPGEPTPVGGFYTQDEMREIVAYAADRHITVIPEIDMPAHSAAAIASYPELACPITDKFVGVFPGIGGPDASIILCAGNEKVYSFYQDVLDEIMDIFPSPYIHIGGDEAEKSHWEKCPLCNKKKQEEGLADFEELQGYFMDRLNKHVRSKGRTPMGWDEVTLGSPKEDMVILGWNGYGQAAVNWAKKTGAKFILTPARVLYLIRYQGPQWFEPFTYFGNVTLKDVYEFEPVKADWTPELKDQLLGVQGSLWSEFINSEKDLEYLLFPRIVAVADMAWRPENSANWPGFLTALDRYMPLLEKRGITPARSMFNLDHKARPSEGTILAEVSCIRPDMEIRYSETDPSLTEAEIYSGPLNISSPKKIHFATFRDGRQEGKTLTLDFGFNKATGASVSSPNCNNDLTEVLTNGLRGSEKHSDFEWAGWHNRDAEFTVDLGSIKPVNNVMLGSISNTHICAVSPRRVSVFASADGIDYTLINTVELPDETVFKKGAGITDIDCGQFEGVQARYLRFVAESPGVIPEGFARESAPTWMYFDEVSVY